MPEPVKSLNVWYRQRFPRLSPRNIASRETSNSKLPILMSILCLPFANHLGVDPRSASMKAAICRQRTFIKKNQGDDCAAAIVPLTQMSAALTWFTATPRRQAVDGQEILPAVGSLHERRRSAGQRNLSSPSTYPRRGHVREPLVVLEHRPSHVAFGDHMLLTVGMYSPSLRAVVGTGTCAGAWTCGCCLSSSPNSQL